MRKPMSYMQNKTCGETFVYSIECIVKNVLGSRQLDVNVKRSHYISAALNTVSCGPFQRGLLPNPNSFRKHCFLSFIGRLVMDPARTS